MPRSRLAHHLVALTAMIVVTSAWVAGVASAATPLDTDRDGLPDWWERDKSLTNRYRADSDGDGLPDGRENPDNDGIHNRTEYLAVDLSTTGRQRWRRRAGQPRGPRRRRPEQLAGADARPPPAACRHRRRRLQGRRRSDRRYRSTDRGSHPGAPVGGAPTVPGAASCPIFPATNVWNQRVDGRPVAANSATMIAAIGRDRGLHMDFGSYAGYGIPYQVVTAATPRSPSHSSTRPIGQVGYPIHPLRSSKAAPARPATDTSSWSIAMPAGSSSCSPPARSTGPGVRAVARPGTCAPTPCGRPAGPVPTRPGCRSSPASSATTRSPRAPSGMRCASRPRRRDAPTSTRHATTRASPRRRRCRRWASACA